jgi:DNA invertase Pin-like site-specific DNA recombinase
MRKARKARAERTSGGSPRVIAYLRVSTEEQGLSGGGIAAQREAIEREAERRRWTEVRWVEDAGFSASTLDRPGIQSALAALSSGEADVLVVAKLDRLSRSVYDFAGLMRRSEDEGWGLACLDLGLDSSTPQGRMMARILAVFAEFEREMISSRTRDGMAAKKASGTLRGRIGRPVRIPESVRTRIQAMRRAGATLAGIAQTLTSEGVPTASGGSSWRISTVDRVLRSEPTDGR